MKRCSKRFLKTCIALSIAMNVIVALPSVFVFLASDGLRLYLYEQAATRFGETQIVFLGDSITRDGGIWGWRIGSPFFKVRNLAHSGLYTEQMLYQAQIAVSEKAETAFIMSGINDVPKTDTGVDKSFAAYVQVLEVLNDGGVEPVIQSTLYRENGVDAPFVSGLNQRLREYAEENGIVFLDLNRLLCEKERLKPEYSRDGTHLTEEAHEVWAKEIRRHLKGR